MKRFIIDIALLTGNAEFLPETIRGIALDYAASLLWTINSPAFINE